MFPRRHWIPGGVSLGTEQMDLKRREESSFQGDGYLRMRIDSSCRASPSRVSSTRTRALIKMKPVPESILLRPHLQQHGGIPAWAPWSQVGRTQALKTRSRQRQFKDIRRTDGRGETRGGGGGGGRRQRIPSRGGGDLVGPKAHAAHRPQLQISHRCSQDISDNSSQNPKHHWHYSHETNRRIHSKCVKCFVYLQVSRSVKRRHGLNTRLFKYCVYNKGNEKQYNWKWMIMSSLCHLEFLGSWKRSTTWTGFLKNID